MFKIIGIVIACIISYFIITTIFPETKELGIRGTIENLWNGKVN